MVQDKEEKSKIASQKLHDEPSSILVFGCGLAAVDGVYEFAGRRNTEDDGEYYEEDMYDEEDGIELRYYDSPVYSMSGRWNGQSMKYLLTYRPSDKRWCLQFEDWVTLYRSKPASMESKLPPSRGWWFVKEEHAHVDLKVNLHDAMRQPILFYENEVSLDWRTDPDENLSDYTIEIVHRPSGEKSNVVVNDYHVHKCIMAQSIYFAGLFSAKGKSGHTFTEGHDNKSRISLDPCTAAVFPQLLDYMYWHVTNFQMTGFIRPKYHTADASLYWLADYLGVAHLRREMESCLEYIDWSNCHEFIRDALHLGVQPVIDEIRNHCTGNLMFMDEEDMELIVPVINAAFLTSILEKVGMTPDRQKKASEIVAKFCAHHAPDAATFLALTDASLLGVIAYEAAWSLLESERKLLSSDAAAASAADGSTSTSLSCLHKRCIVALAPNFKVIRKSKDHPLHLMSREFMYELFFESQKEFADVLVAAQLAMEEVDGRNVRQRMH